MATEFELALFKQELGEISVMPEAMRWKLERDETVPLGLFVTMHPTSKPEEHYKARLRWANYFDAPSLKFLHLQTNAENDPAAWPACFGFRPSSFDACLPWTAEGHALHPEWKNSASHKFPNVELPMQFALLSIQLSLDTNYSGRGSK